MPHAARPLSSRCAARGIVRACVRVRACLSRVRTRRARDAQVEGEVVVRLHRAPAADGGGGTRAPRVGGADDELLARIEVNCIVKFTTLTQGKLV